MGTKHTPGPWRVIDGWDENGNGKYFPTVILFGTEDEHRKTLGRNSITINTSHDQEVESLMANAKLIAAAPELLEALQRIIKESAYVHGFDDPCDCPKCQAINAINKAL